MFYSAPFCERRLHSCPKPSEKPHCITLHPVTLHSIFYTLPQNFSTFICFTFWQIKHLSFPNHSGEPYYVTLQPIPHHSKILASFPQLSTTFYCDQFILRMMHFLLNNSRTSYCVTSGAIPLPLPRLSSS